MSKIYLIEDHDEALRIWREKGFKNLDLVHIDAHIDFGFHSAKPKEQIIKEAKTLKQLKRDLEKSLLYQRYQKDFDKQTNIGNYIYPAICEGIIKDFYWVIPGRLKEFKQSLKLIKKMFKDFAQQDPYLLQKGEQKIEDREEGIIATKLSGRKFIICTLEKLPNLKQKVLLDIDTDFLVIDSLLNASNTTKIGKRKPWIRPDRLIKELHSKELKSVFTTIAYSVNGSYTPILYKVLGDELAYRLSPKHFKEHFRNKFIASFFFKRFKSSGKKEDYQKAIKLDTSYQAADNNYGPLYLSIRKFSRAKREFLKVAMVDPNNPYPFLGLGSIALEKGDFYKAKRHFSYALKLKRNLFPALFGLAKTEFKLNNFKKAKDLFCHGQSLQPLQPQTYYFLGQIYERERNFEKAVTSYQDAMKLGLESIDVLYRLLKISYHFKEKQDIIKYVIAKYREFKRGFIRVKSLSLKTGKKIRSLRKVKEKMLTIEKRLEKEDKTNANARKYNSTQKFRYGN